MRVVIAGAGIGGLTTALSLHAAGITDVVVVEAATELRALGVGVNILPNAVRELTELEVYEPLAAKAIPTAELVFYNRFGDLIWREPRGVDAGYRYPQLSVHRGDLYDALLDAVLDRLGSAAVVTAARVTGRTSAGVSTSAGTFEGDVVIGADGIKSGVRAALYPDEGPPPGNGLVMWRGTSWAPPFLTGRSQLITGDDVRKIVLYPIRRSASGEVLLNWVAVRPAAGGVADWNQAVPVSLVLEHFGDWRFDWLDFPAIFAASREVYEYPMVDREPLPRWTFGRTTLLGDAAHAMYPMGSNGATQTIIDARCIAAALASTGDIDTALAAYETQRRPAMTALQASNRRQGPEVVITIAHERAPRGFSDIEQVIPRAELEEISRRYATTGGFDVETVNES